MTPALLEPLWRSRSWTLQMCTWGTRVTWPTPSRYLLWGSLESLAAQTCDEIWSPMFVHRNPTLGTALSNLNCLLDNIAAYLVSSRNVQFSDLSHSEHFHLHQLHTQAVHLVPCQRHSHRKARQASKKQPRVVTDLQRGLSTLQVETGVF